MSWTDESGNPVCECGHLWSNHHQTMEVYYCEAPDCPCERFSAWTAWDEFAEYLGEEEEEKTEGARMTAQYYDCERHGKGKGPDCPTCSMSDEKIAGRYMGGHDE